MGALAQSKYLGSRRPVVAFFQSLGFDFDRQDFEGLHLYKLEGVVGGD